MDRGSKTTEVIPNLSAQILEYYQKYAKNRDLGKYLRVRKSNGDIAESTLGSATTDTNLSKDSKASDNNDDFCQEEQSFDEAITVCRNKCLQPDPSKNFSKVDLIEANISAHKEPNVEISSACDESKEVEATTDACIQTDSKVSNGLTNSNKSNKPLEWDSLGDVGYDKQSPQNIIGNHQLSSLERNVLRNFFSQRGIMISFTESSHRKRDSDLNLKLNGQNKPEKWRQTLENVRRKYNKVESPKSSTISEYVCSGLSTYAEVHSTPKFEIEVDSKTFEENFQKEGIKTKDRNDLSSKCRKYDDLISSTSFEYIPENRINKSLEKENSTVTAPLKASKNDKRYSESYENKKELQAGFKLLSTLVKAKGLSNQEKVVFVKKIIKKLSSFEQSSHVFTQEPISKKQSLSIIKDKTTEDCLHDAMNSQSTAYSVSSIKSSSTNTSSSDMSMSLKMTVRSVPGIPCTNTNKNCNFDGQQKTKSRIRSITSNASRETVNSKKCGKRMNAQIHRKNGNYFQDVKIINTVNNGTGQFELMNEWLEPLTASELKHLSNTEQSATEVRSDTTPKIEATHEDNLRCFFEKEKKIHLNWIESEIDHLRNLKNLLEQVKEGEGTLRSEFLAFHDRAGSSDVPFSQGKKKSEKAKPRDRLYNASIKDSNNFVPLKSEPNNAFESVRSKLQTPSSELEGSVRSFVRHRRQKFLENYRKAHYKSCNNRMESGHYSEPREEKVAQNSTGGRSNTLSSTPNILVSSDSMSIVCTTNCSTTASIQHYGTIIEKATQTNDSLEKSRPILGGNSCCICNNPFLCVCFKKTIRTYPNRINKAAQAKPQAEAYVITFYKSKDKTETDPSETGIQQVLQKNYPKFIERADERREALKTMRHRRTQRKLLKDSIIQNNSMNSIENKISKLKPTVNDDIRIFAPEEMKTITTRRYLQLNEVVQKAEKEKAEKNKRCNKILVEIFNKKVQRQVRKGKSSFPLL